VNFICECLGIAVKSLIGFGLIAVGVLVALIIADSVRRRTW
jgi:hypothetical protein